MSVPPYSLKFFSVSGVQAFPESRREMNPLHPRALFDKEDVDPHDNDIDPHYITTAATSIAHTLNEVAGTPPAENRLSEGQSVNLERQPRIKLSREEAVMEFRRMVDEANADVESMWESSSTEDKKIIRNMRHAFCEIGVYLNMPEDILDNTCLPLPFDIEGNF